MVAEPLVIYSHMIDPEGVLDVLRALAPSLDVTRGPDAWETITISEPRGFMRRPSTISFTHSPDYYAGPGWALQMEGMQGYFSRFPHSANSETVQFLIASFRFGLSVHPEPSPALLLGTSDPRLRYLFAVLKHLDGALFTPSSLRDASGRILMHASEPPDPDARMPAICAPLPRPEDLPRYAGGTAPDPPPPPASRVARRALALGAVSWRCMLEREDGPAVELERQRTEFLQWIAGVDIGSELEDDEWHLLRQPVGSVGDQAMECEWRIEGASVLAWALGRFELPPFDQQISVAAIGRVLGLSTVERGRAFLSSPVLRPAGELEHLSRQLLGVHWRLREQRLKPGRQSFREHSQHAWFGKLPLEGIRFIDDDLAIGEHAVSAAPPDVLMPCILTVQERHRAINWLCGADPVYSRVDTPT